MQQVNQCRNPLDPFVQCFSPVVKIQQCAEGNKPSPSLADLESPNILVEPKRNRCPQSHALIVPYAKPLWHINTSPLALRLRSPFITTKDSVKLGASEIHNAVFQAIRHSAN